MTAQIRHRHQPAAGTVRALDNNRASMEFDTPVMAITPGQAVVFYDGEIVVGGWVDRLEAVPQPNTNRRSEVQEAEHSRSMGNPRTPREPAPSRAADAARVRRRRPPDTRAARSGLLIFGDLRRRPRRTGATAMAHDGSNAMGVTTVAGASVLPFFCYKNTNEETGRCASASQVDTHGTCRSPGQTTHNRKTL